MRMQNIFSNMKTAPEEEYLQDVFKKHISGNKTNQKRLNIEINQAMKQLETLQLEIGKAVTGSSPFSPEDLSSAIKNLKL